VDYDEQAKEDVIRCLSLDDGRDMWQYRYPVVIKPNHGITRAVPAVTDEYLVAIGPKGHVTCLHPMSGELKWTLDPVERFGGKIPPWYSGQCPLIEDEKLVLAVGGDSLLAAIDCRSGELLWWSGNPRRWKMTHSSVMPLEFGGRRQYVYCASDGVVGIDAGDGRILWEFRDWRVRMANVPAPLVVGPGRMFLCGGYGAGSVMVQLRHEAGQFAAEEVFRLAEDVFGAHVHTPILFAGHIYGVRMDGQLVCIDLQGKLMWTSGGDRRFGLGPYLIADGKIYVMDDKAMLTLAEATPSGYVELARAKLFDGRDAWGAAAMASGRLILRDFRKMICVDVTDQSTSGRTGQRK
jgi:outer membrane protein assembly factor BamB